MFTHVWMILSYSQTVICHFILFIQEGMQWHIELRYSKLSKSLSTSAFKSALFCPLFVPVLSQPGPHPRPCRAALTRCGPISLHGGDLPRYDHCALFSEAIDSTFQSFTMFECHLTPGGAGDLDFYHDVIRVGGGVDRPVSTPPFCCWSNLLLKCLNQF